MISDIASLKIIFNGFSEACMEWLNVHIIWLNSLISAAPTFRVVGPGATASCPIQLIKNSKLWRLDTCMHRLCGA